MYNLSLAVHATQHCEVCEWIIFSEGTQLTGAKSMRPVWICATLSLSHRSPTWWHEMLYVVSRWKHQSGVKSSSWIQLGVTYGRNSVSMWPGVVPLSHLCKSCWIASELKQSGDTVSDNLSHGRAQRADGWRRLITKNHAGHVPAVLLAALAEGPVLLGVARDADAVLGTGGRFSTAPLSGVWKSQQRSNNLWVSVVWEVMSVTVYENALHRRVQRTKAKRWERGDGRLIWSGGGNEEVRYFKNHNFIRSEQLRHSGFVWNHSGKIHNKYNWSGSKVKSVQKKKHFPLFFHLILQVFRS